MFPYYLVLPVYAQGLVLWWLPGGRGQGKHQEQRHREDELCKILSIYEGQWAVGGYWPWCWSGSCPVERSPGPRWVRDGTQGRCPITQALGNVTFREPPDVGKSKQRLGCSRFRNMYPQRPLVNSVGRTASHGVWPALECGLSDWHTRCSFLDRCLLSKLMNEICKGVIRK